MKKFKEINKKRKTFIDSESLGCLVTEYYYSKRDGTAEKENNKIKNKSVAINIRMSKSDVEAFDFLSEVFKTPRAALIANYMTADIKAMFNALETTEKTGFAEIVDQSLTTEGFEHAFRGATWLWDVVEPDQNAYNPANQKIWNQIKKNLKK